MYSFHDMMMYDTNKIISEVKKRPALYNKNHADYHDKEVREQLFTDICWKLFPNWSDLDEFDRQIRFKDVQKKWRNVRDSFRKELKFQRKQKPGAVRKKRQYVYSNQMKFMIPFILNKDASGAEIDIFDSETMQEDEEKEEETENEDSSEIIKFKLEGEGDTQSSNSSQDSSVGNNEQNQDPTQPVLEMWDNSLETDEYYNDSQYSLQADVDEDKYFLLSLIPSFKNLTRRQKLTAKVEFLQVLQKITSESDKRTSN